MFPASPRDWLPEGHLAYFVMDVVGQLDLSTLYGHYERELRGYPPHHPQMMVSLLLYAYSVGVASSRKIERRTYEDVAFRFIAGGQHPDHTTISEFRRVHLQALSGLFVQMLALCVKAGLVRLGHVALDGTKVKANASKHKAMSYERMKQQERVLSEKVTALMRSAEEADAAEDKLYGKKKRGDELPDELARAVSRLAKIREAKAALEAEARAARKAEEAEKQRDDDEAPPSGPTPLPAHRVQSEQDGTPKPKAQRNFTDPESRIQRTKDGFVQGFNAQVAVDEGHQIIVAQALTNQPPDVEHFVPLLEQVIENCGEAPGFMTADAGYFSEENIFRAAQMGVEAYIPARRNKHGEAPPPVRGRAPEEMTLKKWMTRRLATKKGRERYARRKAVAEPPFGQIKQVRGFRQMLLRGLEKARGEWTLICLTHNLLKLHRAAAG